MLPRLRKRSEFVKLAQKGKKLNFRSMIVQAIATDNSDLRIGFTASRKVGNAVKRNRAKRRMRALAEMIFAPHQAIEIVLIAKPELLTSPFSLLIQELSQACTQLNVKKR